jgi:hypothetical protein
MTLILLMGMTASFAAVACDGGMSQSKHQSSSSTTSGTATTTSAPAK